MPTTRTRSRRQCRPARGDPHARQVAWHRTTPHALAMQQDRSARLHRPPMRRVPSHRGRGTGRSATLVRRLSCCSNRAASASSSGASKWSSGPVPNHGISGDGSRSCAAEAAMASVATSGRSRRADSSSASIAAAALPDQLRRAAARPGSPRARVRRPPPRPARAAPPVPPDNAHSARRCIAACTAGAPVPLSAVRRIARAEIGQQHAQRAVPPARG